MKPYSAVLLLISAVVIAAYAETSSCLDLADESHHQLLFSNHGSHPPKFITVEF